MGLQGMVGRAHYTLRSIVLQANITSGWVTVQIERWKSDSPLLQLSPYFWVSCVLEGIQKAESVFSRRHGITWMKNPGAGCGDKSKVTPQHRLQGRCLHRTWMDLFLILKKAHSAKPRCFHGANVGTTDHQNKGTRVHQTKHRGATEHSHGTFLKQLTRT